MKYGVITIDQNRNSGTPLFSHTDVPVQALFEYLEEGKPIAKFLDDYPSVNMKDVVEVLQMAKVMITSEKMLKENFSDRT